MKKKEPIVIWKEILRKVKSGEGDDRGETCGIKLPKEDAIAYCEVMIQRIEDDETTTISADQIQNNLGLKDRVMNADLKEALKKINKTYRAFEHRGKKMTKDEVKKVLEYGIKKGYQSTGELSNEEVDKLLKR